MSKETELSDKAIKDMHQYHYGVERYLKFARAVIAADRELRQGDAGMPVICHALEWTFDGEERGMRLYDDERHCLFDSQSDGGVCSPLVRQSDAQAALAEKDAAYQSAVNGRAEMRQALRDSRAEIAALTAERDVLKKDAERYCWLDANGLFAQPQGYDTQLGIASSDAPDGILFVSSIGTHVASTAIDAAIAKEAAK